jgi:phosphoglycerate dehydrogenase-like enzyme
MTFKLLMLPPQTDVERGWARRLTADVPDLNVVVAETEEEAAREIADAQAAFGLLGRETLAKAKDLKYLLVPQSGPPPGTYYPELIQHPVVASNFRGLFNDHISHHVMAMVLSAARDLPRYITQQARGEWHCHPEDDVVHLPESTMLIIGLGNIGAEIARLASAFGIKVIATDARRGDLPPGLSELHPAQALDDLLPRADFAVLTVPHTPATEGMMNSARFARMKRGAFFINIGRGKTVRLDDLVEALRSGHLGGAGLDVFESEPLLPDHPLWRLPNVIITPHTAGYGPHLNERRYELLRETARAWLAGAPVPTPVDKAAMF